VYSGDWTEKRESGHSVKKNPFTRAASALSVVVVVGVTFGGIAALSSSPSQAFADTSTSTTIASTNCVVTGASGTAVATSPVVDPNTATPAPATLAFTGTDLAVAAVVGVLLVGAGLIMVLGSRAPRRRGSKLLGCAVLGVLLAHQFLPAGQASAATPCPSPPAVLPEVSSAILLPLSALLAFAAAYLWLRRRRAVGEPPEPASG
jgi:hypothetical protein